MWHSAPKSTWSFRLGMHRGTVHPEYRRRTIGLPFLRVRIAGCRDYKRSVRLVVKPGSLQSDDGVYSYSVLVQIEHLDRKRSSCGVGRESQTDYRFSVSGFAVGSGDHGQSPGCDGLSTSTPQISTVLHRCKRLPTTVLSNEVTGALTHR